MVAAVEDELGVGARDQIDQHLGVAGEFARDLEPLVLGLHEVAVERLDQTLVVPLQLVVLPLERLHLIEQHLVLRLQLLPAPNTTPLCASHLRAPSTLNFLRSTASHTFLLVLQEEGEFFAEVVDPVLLEEGLVARVFERLLDIGQRIELQKLIGLGQVRAFCLQKLPESRDFLLGDSAFGLDRGVDVVDEEVDPDIELELLLVSEQTKETDEVLAPALAEQAEQFFLEAARGNVVEVVRSLQPAI